MADEQPPAHEERQLLRNIEWGAVVIVTIGTLLLLTGAWRFYLRQHFEVRDAVYGFLWLIPAGVVVAVFDYTFHHARLAATMPLLIAGVLCFASPGFDLTLGIVLIGTILLPAISDWQEARIRKPAEVGTERADARK